MPIRNEYIYLDYSITSDVFTLNFSTLTASDEDRGRVPPTFTNPPQIEVTAVRGNNTVFFNTSDLTATSVIFRLGDGDPAPLSIDFKIIDRESDVTIADTDLGDAINQIRRMTADQGKGGAAFVRTNTELTEYLKDAAREVRMDLDSFEDFTIDEINGIVPTATDIELRLLVLKATNIIYRDSFYEATGDAIHIKAGVTLDTSKSLRGWGELISEYNKEYDKLLKKLKLGGDYGTTGSRIDTYKSETTDVREPKALI